MRHLTRLDRLKGSIRQSANAINTELCILLSLGFDANEVTNEHLKIFRAAAERVMHETADLLQAGKRDEE